MPRPSPAVLVLTLALAASAARGDQIVTRNGTTFEGKIVAEDATHYTIETADLGALRIAKTDVTRILRPDQPPPAAGAKTPPAGTAGGDAPKPPKGAKPPKPTEEELARKAAEEEAARKAEQERLDAEERIARRRAATLRRTTTPGAEKPPAPPARTEEDAEREKAREALTGAAFAATPAGSLVVVFEPPRPFQLAPAGIAVGRRTWATFELAGTASAFLTVTFAAERSRVAIRLADVQRHIVAKTEASRIRLFEGITGPDWLRLRMEDGTEVAGRFADVSETSVRLLVPADDAAPKSVEVEAAKVVQVDGLLASIAVTRALGDIEAGEPLGIVHWPDGAETVGRFIDRMEHHIRLDTDLDGQADRVIAVDGPIADVRRVPAKWRDTARAIRADAVVRVRGFEDFPDVRIERVATAPLAALTAYTVAVRSDRGASVIPFESVVSLDVATPQDAANASRPAEIEGAHLPLLPGARAEDARGMELPAGVSFIGDRTTVTHVYVAPPCDATLWGLRLGDRIEDCLGSCDLYFGTEVSPRVEGGAPRSREYVSDSVPGMRVTVCTDARGTVSAIEIARR